MSNITCQYNNCLFLSLSLSASLLEQVAVVVTEPDSDQVEEVSTPPTDPQVEPIEAAEP